MNETWDLRSQGVLLPRALEALSVEREIWVTGHAGGKAAKRIRTPSVLIRSNTFEDENVLILFQNQIKINFFQDVFPKPPHTL